MARVIKMRVPYYQREITNNNSGNATFFLNERPEYLPSAGQNIIVTHTNVPSGSGLERKLQNYSTNTVSAVYNSYTLDQDNEDINNGFVHFFELQYDDVDFGNNSGGGDCFGYLEYEVNPSGVESLKSIESSVIVTENVPFDGDDGIHNLSGITTATNGDYMPIAFAERTDSTDVFGNLFTTFGLPVTEEQKKKYTQSPLGGLVPNQQGDIIINGTRYNWSTGNTTNLGIHPYTGHSGDFYQTAYSGFNTDKIVVLEMPRNKYGEIIDGRSIKLTIPSGSTSGHTIYSAFKKDEVRLNNNGFINVLSEPDYNAAQFGVRPDFDGNIDQYESNVAFLFCDDIQPPQDSSFSSWGDGHSDVINGQKVYSKSNVQKPFFNFYKDYAVGIAYLDKGFVVLTDPTIVNNFESAVTLGNTGSTSGITIATQFLFDENQTGGGFVHPTIEYKSFNTEKTLNIVCLASTSEFFRTSNPTGKALVGIEDEVFVNFKTDMESDSLKPIKITEIGIHDADGNLLAIAKPSEPIEKFWYDVVSFNIKIRL